MIEDRPDPDSPAAIPARLNLALLGAVSLACAGLLWGASHAPGAVATAACAVLFAAAANTAFALLHEAVHGVFSPRRAVNEWAGRLAAAWFPTGFAMQRAYHLTHHRNNRSRLEQFDLIHEGDVRWLKLAQWYAILTGVYWAMTVAGAAAYLLVPRALRARLLAAAGPRAAEQTSAGPYHAALDALDPLEARLEILLSFGFHAALWVLLDLSPGGWLACYAAFGLTWSSLQYADHAFSPLDPRDGAWNLRVGRIARTVFLNYHFHRAHHRNPRVPWNRLPETADPAEPQPTFWRVWRAMWGGPRREPGLDFDAPAAAPFLGLPRGLDAWAAVVLTGAFAGLFAALYGGASLLTGLDPRRLDVALPFEQAIPFVPAAAAVYLSGTVLLVLAPFVLRRGRDLWALFSALAAETVAGAAVFLALPVRGSFPEREVEGGGIVAALFGFADALNLERNELPSLHVALALTAALAYGRGRGPLARVLLAGWAMAVAASALLLHEHHLLDVAAGLALGTAGFRIAGGWARRPAVAAAFEIDLLCLREAALFGRRHPRYWLIALILAGASLPRWRSRRVLRTGFCFLQHADDLLDGDRPCEREPLEAVDELIAAIESGRFGEEDRMRLAEAFAADLRGAGGEPALALAIELLRTMQRDRRRVLDRTLLDRGALLEHHRRTFTRSLDLMLLAAGSELRSSDVPELADALGWCSTMRDLREDLEAGLVNVPREVIEAARGEGCRSLDHDELVAIPVVRAWLAEELARAGRLLDAADRRLAALRGRRGARALHLFARSIRGFAERRFPRRFPGVEAAAQGTAFDQAEVSPLSRPSAKIVSPAGGGGTAGVPARK